MFSKEQSIEIDAGPEDVYDYVSDLNTHPKWANEAMEMSVDGSQNGVGTTFSTHVKMFGDQAGTGKVVTADRPRTFAYECTDSSGTFRWTFNVEPSGNGTRLTHRLERLAAPLYFRLLQGVAFYPIFGRKGMSSGLDGIKKNVEAAKAA